MNEQFLLQKKYLHSELLLLLVLSVFSSVVLAGYFIEYRLYWDNLKLFSFFRDNLQSLNYFGNIQWWNPHAARGFPIYYTSILGTNGITPLFVILGGLAWLLGRCHILIPSYHLLYVFYFGFVIPFLFNLSLLFLSRQIFKDKLPIGFILLTASFSPGILFNLSDIGGLEQAAYGIFFAAAYLHFKKNLTRSAFLLLVLSVLLLTISLNHLSLYWNIIFVPAFFCVCSIFNESAFSANAKKMIRSVPAWYWAIALILLILCLLPALLTFSQGQDIIRTKIGERTYAYADLAPGNPLEILTSATPGVGYAWGSGGWQPVGSGFTQNSVGYVYLGMLTLPLSLIGLLAGRRVWRLRLFGLIAFFSLVVILSGHSPLFSSVLIWQSPLRAVNHFSDTLFRNGLFFLMILSAGLGVETVFYGRSPVWRRFLLLSFLITSAGSLFLFSLIYREATLRTPLFGFALVIFLFYFIVLAWLIQTKNRQRRIPVFVFLLCLVFTDVSTVAFSYVRNIVWPRSSTYAEPPLNSIGGDVAISAYANHLLALRDVSALEAKGVNFSELPQLALFPGFRGMNLADITGPVMNDAITKDLILPKEYEADEGFRHFTEKKAWVNTPAGQIKVVKQTYNSLELEVSAPEDGLLFWKDTYFPYWRAFVNERQTKIARAFGVFKAIIVPSQVSKVTFKFSPGFIPQTLLAAYGSIFMVLCLWVKAAFFCKRGAR